MKVMKKMSRLKEDQGPRALAHTATQTTLKCPPPSLPAGCKQSFGLTVNYILSFDIFSCHFF